MGKYISLNDEWIIDISEIQSVHFEVEEVNFISKGTKTAERYTKITGKEVPEIDLNLGFDMDSKFDVKSYDKITIELKGERKLVIKDFDLSLLKNYIISQLGGTITTFECAEISYREVSKSLTIDGDLDIEAKLKTGDFPVDLDLSWSSHSDPIDVKLSD
ncbi:hypothetical protein [Nostoc sp. 'Peltigera membranacea cyanobiont' N6]|uniref:hypothetical protein n=1 Tax=Nostoc sp. 'Peltigera membranacea cyanobiont' N6 TaxID=1261031 RepID=UPI000CF3198B|nr:hypothetical protein [Nostoc sp. 'Peltigera membranacea cyanobiont' N6]AVH67050.1 hypothetical protein NPM_5619 [Nostoc sp. 'Peltigera membranacea cyanobiont' N6]